VLSEIIDFDQIGFSFFDQAILKKYTMNAAVYTNFGGVLDAVGKSTFCRCKKILNKGGVYFSTEFGPYYQNIVMPKATGIIGDKKMKVSSSQT
jgi:hypothetical protein